VRRLPHPRMYAEELKHRLALYAAHTLQLDDSPSERVLVLWNSLAACTQANWSNNKGRY